MAKSVIIKLTTAGTSTGPFNLLSNYDSYVTPFETNIAKTTLVTGYTSSLVPDTATIIRVLSSGSCTNHTDLTIVPTTTTTTTTTSTTTTTTTFGYQATIAFSIFNDGGIRRGQALVTSGTTLDNLNFSGTIYGYEFSGCTGTQTDIGFSDMLSAGSPFEVFGNINLPILSAQYNPLIIEGITITVFAQTITVGGNNYLITGATNCFETPF
jgi:hypothetical protein